MVKIDGDEFLTVGEAARLLGVKAPTVYAYVSRGILRSFRQGIRRRRLYRRRDVDALLRLGPATEPRAPARPRARGSRQWSAEEIPPAETWIRD